MTRALHKRRFVMHAGVLLALLTGLSACAPEPVVGWRAVEIDPVVGVALVSDGGLLQDEDRDNPASPGAQPADDVAQPGVPATPDATIAARQQLDGGQLGLYEGRIRNDALGVAARFVYVPGVAAFNDWVNGQIWAAIQQRADATGVSYSPEAHPVSSGLGDRGCVPGSLSWRALDVLARPETGPAGGVGTAIVCEITAAFGDLIEVRMRTVDGSPEQISSDITSVLYANVASGEIVEIVDEWTSAAPAELWRATVELLRREQGALSTAVIVEPGEDQLQIAQQALDGSRAAEGGALSVTMQSGIAAPELSGLGIERTEEPTQLYIEPATALSWSNEDYRTLHSAIGNPFTGEVAPVNRVPIDCGLIACVALTYDDGPSDYTQQLLNTLQAERARATFYMLGHKAGGWSRTIARVAAEGHEIGSHTMTHPDLTDLSLEEARAQVLDAAAALQQVSGQTISTFRPPYGAVNDEIIEVVGMPAVLWSIDTNDWRKPGQEELVKRGVEGVRPGGIILFHDIHRDSVEVAGAVVRGLRDRGFETVTVTQLFNGAVPAGRVSAR